MILSPEEIKKKTGIYAADFVKPGMTIGVGTGTTVYWFIQELGKRVAQGLEIKAVPTSNTSEQLARELKIELVDLNTVQSLALTIDGTDEIDLKGQLIKGGGGALLQEKIVAAASDELIIIADYSKLVPELGSFPLPIEVIPFGYEHIIRKINESGISQKVLLRKKDGQPFITDHKHYILDCACEKIDDAFLLNTGLHLIPGVVETGLFINMASKAVIGYGDGKVEVLNFEL